MTERVTSIVRRKLRDSPDSGLSAPGTPEDRVALVGTLTAEAWSLVGLRVPEDDRAAAPIHIRPLRAVPPVGPR